MPTEILRHSKIHLALHQLSTDPGEPLLLLHPLGLRTPAALPGWAEGWDGPVYGLDFTGHGQSTIPKGGGYTCEVLMADADAALTHLDHATVLGQGLGAYVALLLAGARPLAVRGAILCDGPGLAGGGPTAGSMYLPTVDPNAVVPPDPFALAELARDVRPPEYAEDFLRQATQFSDLEYPIAICARVRPPWVEAVAAAPGVIETTRQDALEMYGRAGPNAG